MLFLLRNEIAEKSFKVKSTVDHLRKWSLISSFLQVFKCLWKGMGID